MDKPALYQAIQELIAPAQNILVVTHLSPDGDALGSLSAMGQALINLGKTVTIACDDLPQERFLYLPLLDQVQKRFDPYPAFDLLIALDCGDEQRMGRLFERMPHPRPPVINIDHHITNTLFGTVNFIDGAATATTEILTEMLPALGAPITHDIAMSLMTGLVTDTLCFRTSNVNAKTLNIASQLMTAGADLATITREALILRSYAGLRLISVALKNMQLEDGVCWTVISLKEQREIGEEANSNLGIANLLSDVYEAQMSVVFTEKEGRRITVGFRSRPPFDVSELATELGGGGHKYASGCTMTGRVVNAVSLIVPKATASIKAQKKALGWVEQRVPAAK